ncbi:MAG: peptidoglycan-binding domain-containing protein [Patescibacteria group bacterium]
MSRILCLPAPIVSPYFATTALLAVVIFCCSFFFAAPIAHAEGLSPKQMSVIQGLLSTYGVPDGKIKAVSAILKGGPDEHSSSTLRTQMGSTTPPKPPRPAPASTSSREQSSAGSVLQFIADYSDSFNDNLAAVVTAPFAVLSDVASKPQSNASAVLQFTADYSDSFNSNLAAVATAPFEILTDALSDVMVSLGVGQSANTVLALADDYGTGASPTSGVYCPKLSTTLQKGSRDNGAGGQVTELQAFLTDYYNLDENVVVGGYFGKLTQQYVVQFQQEKGLPALGIVGQLTRAAIAAACSGSSNNSKESTTSTQPNATNAQSGFVFNSPTNEAIVSFGGSLTVSWTFPNPRGYIYLQLISADTGANVDSSLGGSIYQATAKDSFVWNVTTQTSEKGTLVPGHYKIRATVRDGNDAKVIYATADSKAFTITQGTATKVQTQTTNSGGKVVDLKVNGSDGPVTLSDGDAITLSWTSTNPAFTFCQLAGAITPHIYNTTQTSGSMGASAWISSPDSSAVRTITVHCAGADLSVNGDDSVVVNVKPTASSVTSSLATCAYTSSGTGLTSQISFNTDMAQTADNCKTLCTGSRNEKYGLSDSGYCTYTSQSGVKSVMAISAAVTVSAPACKVGVTPATIVSGQSVTISWTSTNANYVYWTQNQTGLLLGLPGDKLSPSGSQTFTVSGKGAATLEANLVVVSSTGAQATCSGYVVVTDSTTQAPVVFSAWPNSGTVPLAVTFSTYLTSNYINFGDGSVAWVGGGSSAYSGFCSAATADSCTYNVTHTYSQPGTYTAKLMSSGQQMLSSTAINVSAASQASTTGAF